MAMDAIKESFSFKRGPRSPLSEVIGIAFMAVVLLGIAFTGGSDYSFALIFLAGYVVMTGGRYAWWHFHPYQAPPPPAVTRYTNLEYTKR
jgi:hypothetical protein